MTLQGEKSGKVFKVGQAIRVKLTKADKETGDIDFEYLPSEFDVIEKVSKETKSKAHNHKGPRHQKKTPKTEQEEKAGSKKRKSRKPFYKDVAKKKSRKRS